MDPPKPCKEAMACYKYGSFKESASGISSELSSLWSTSRRTAWDQRLSREIKRQQIPKMFHVNSWMFLAAHMWWAWSRRSWHVFCPNKALSMERINLPQHNERSGLAKSWVKSGWDATWQVEKHGTYIICTNHTLRRRKNEEELYFCLKKEKETGQAFSSSCELPLAP